jgi:hypothetical protein
MVDNIDDSLVLPSFRNWLVRGESASRVIHFHGDREARNARAQILAAFKPVAEDSLAEPKLDMAGLDTEIRRIAEELGLRGHAGECECQRDPLHQVIDVWFSGAQVQAR